MQTVNDFLSMYTSKRASMRATRTIRAEQDMLRSHIMPTIGHLPLMLLRKKHILDVLNAITINGHNRTAQAVYTYLRTASKGNKHFHAVMLSIDRPTHKPKEICYLSPEEARKLILYSNPQWSPVWLLMLTLGLRRGEVCGLRWSDFDFERKQINIRNQRQYIPGKGCIDMPPKSDSGIRSLPLMPIIEDALAPLYAVHEAESLIGSASPYVFKGNSAGGLNPSSVDHALKRECNNLSIRRVTVHGLRHTFATSSVTAGANIRVLSDMLGHASITTTAHVYAHVDMSPKQDLADAVLSVIGNSKRSTPSRWSI